MTRGAIRPRPKGHHLSHRVVIWATVTVVAGLAAINVMVHEGGVDSLWLAPPCAVMLLGAARWLGLTWTELGLGRDRLKAGLLWGGGAVAVIALVYAIGVLLPLTRDAFRDSRYHVGAGSALFTAFVRIPLGTVLFEELAFRGVLWALLARHLSRWWVLGITSVLFGMWHVLAATHFGGANAGVNDVVGSGGAAKVTTVLGTVAFTTLGGVVFGEARRRSGSLLASIGFHWATNGLGVLFGLWAWTFVA